MSLPLARIAAQLFDTPLLLRPETAIAIASSLSDRFGLDPMEAADDLAVIEASRFRGKPGPAQMDGGRPMYRVENGIALIAVHGELVNRGAWIGASSGLTSYEGLDATLRGAAADPNVRGVLLDMNSPGGEASGAMETAALVRSIDATKPVVAFVNGMAASAGYAIASGARSIVTTPSGVLGSIGVVLVHVDRSGALAKAGLKPTLIHAGAHKVDGSSLAALPDDARARIQSSVDTVYDLFVKTVATHRGLTQKAVRATEGGIRMGQAAVDAGLADLVGTFDDALALLAPKPLEPGAFSMSDAPKDMISQAAHEAALAETRTKASTTADVALAADRARTKAILGHDEAKGREALAHKLAFETSLTVEAAVDMLKAADRKAAATASTKGRLAVENPDLKPDAGNPAEQPGAAWGAIVDDLNTKAGFAKH